MQFLINVLQLAYAKIREKTLSPRCLLNINKTRLTAYHQEGNGQVENPHKTLRSMLKARAGDDPQDWNEQLDYCMMVFRRDEMG